MRIFHRLGDQPSFSSGTAVAIGNFDGLHLGHRKILNDLVRIAGEKKLRSLVLTFSPHPEKVLEKSSIRMIQTLEQRLAGLRACGIDLVMVIPFNKAFARLPGEDFVRSVLIREFGARAILVGRNFHFGRHRESDIVFLRRTVRNEGIIVKVIPPVVRDCRTVSSSHIRTLLTCGNIEEANRYLGRPYEIEGEVVRGEARGRIFGFPTANIRTANEILPPGVFVTEAVIRGRAYPSLTNIGLRPTFGGRHLSVECHIIDFNKNIYGSSFRLRFRKKLRNELRFHNAEDLRRRIAQDAAETRFFFERPAKRRRLGRRP